ncbi:hypothetical protein PR202_ga25741 [Eleusine coracana subsp. coracana]|uniref:Uncharacterized protein n=1 Tax=Eleusine coracana subsp. coracana TaxID=191504 RepID=A0AAV5DC38_ELECO|nr:hypothetical protein PR202_ga25741 [Eleusine coracana subsp. coracana]
MPVIKSEFDGGDESDHEQSGSDEEGFNVVVADSCQRVFVYGLKILWNLENRAAVLSWVGGLTQAFQPPKPSPSRQYTQRKILEKKQLIKEAEVSKDGALNSSPSASQSSESQQIKSSESPPSNGSSKSDLTSSNETVVQVGQEMFEKALGSSNIAAGDAGPEMTWLKPLKDLTLIHRYNGWYDVHVSFQVYDGCMTNLLFAKTLEDIMYLIVLLLDFYHPEPVVALASLSFF